MCTVSFVKVKNKVIITSNRDEKVVRPNAINPKNYIVNGKNVIYPKDPKAGGTWYVINRNNEMKTLSITQAITEQNKVAILHYDLISQKESCTSFIIV